MKQQTMMKASIPILALILMAAGCGEPAVTNPTNNPGNTTPPVTTQAPPVPAVLLASMDTAAGAMNSYKSEMKMGMTMSFLGTQFQMDMTTSMAVDVSGKKLFMDIKGEAIGLDAGSYSQQMYLVNDTMYMLVADPESGLDPNTWYKFVMPESEQQEMWTSQDVGDQLQILMDLAALELLGTETIDGNLCYKVKIVPNTQKFMEYLAVSGDDLADMGITDATQAFKQLDVTFWVNTATYLPAKMDMTMAIDTQGVVVTMLMSATYEDVNQPVNITLPAAAQTAIELPTE
ncbi:DUF6612 family protein [Dehalogenimonas sp. THU2]|uniref:DUF6612 family protein n=1 Tax=Dehalogenimonas sp. THU2 TaxID=3151121 RepID=UPI0032186386